MAALSIAWKDLRIFFKDRGSLLMLFLVPLIFVIVFSGVLSRVGGEDAQEDLRTILPVVNLDGGDAAATLLAGLDASGSLRVESRSEEEARALLAENKLGFVLTIPAGFSAAVASGQPGIVHLTTHPQADSQAVETARLGVEAVASDMALETQIMQALQQMGEMMADAPPEIQAEFSVEKAQAQARSQFKGPGEQPLVGVTQSAPARTEGRGASEEATSGGMLSVPGFAILFVFLAAQSTALSIHEEKKIGSFRRLLAAPISKASLLAGKLLPNFVIALIQIAVIFAFGFFGLRLLGQPPITLGPQPAATVLVLVLLALCSSALGLVIAALARTENQIGGFATLILWVLGIVGGCMIPVFILDQFLGPLPKISPHYWANRALNNLMIRGTGLPGVTLEIGVLLGFTALFFAIGLWRFDYD